MFAYHCFSYERKKEYTNICTQIYIWTILLCTEEYIINNIVNINMFIFIYYNIYIYNIFNININIFNIYLYIEYI